MATCMILSRCEIEGRVDGNRCLNFVICHCCMCYFVDIYMRLTKGPLCFGTCIICSYCDYGDRGDCLKDL